MLKFGILQNLVSNCTRKLYFCDVKNEIIPRVSHFKSELYQKLIMLQPNSPENSQVLKISVLGCPNSGKSSLVNMLTRWDICAVSGKVNTTRSKQTAVLTQDNVQLCFIDMPGVIGLKHGFNFKLEKSLIRDPHVGVFESDLILCVVDVSHKTSHEELNVELLKALHFFKDKPSILVLNKIDKVGQTMKLFDITRRLTEGVVGGKISHKDSYANRYSKMVPTYRELLNDPRTLTLLNKHVSNNKLDSNTVDAIPSFGDVSKNKETVIDLNEKSEFYLNSDKSNVTQDKEIIAKDTNFESEEISDDKKFLELLYGKDSESNIKLDFEIDDPILDVLKKQLMVKSATKEDVVERRMKWREIARQLEQTRESSWKHFDDVFAVSSATGAGIDRLRQYLISKAKPGSWYFHSSLITDQEPESIVRMCVWANCLNTLEKEIPYQLKIQINNYEKSSEGSLHIYVTLRCKTTRQLMAVLGNKGANIATIADNSRRIMQNCFQTDVYLKLVAARDGIPTEHHRRMKSVTDTKQLFPSSSSV